MKKESGWRDKPIAGDETAVQQNVLRKMLITCLACCSFGAIEMYLFHYILLSLIFCATIIVVLLCAVLSKHAVISSQIATMVPMLIFCFIYTPISWVTFDGLMGSTPYQSIIFVTMILLSNYKRGTGLLIGLYLATLAVLTVGWLLHYEGTPPPLAVVSTFIAWALTLALIIVLLENSIKLSREYNRAILDRSMRDALTGLYNRNAIDQIFNAFEARYDSKGEDYVVVMLDIDQFKMANDLHGHVAGDEALKIVAQNIQAVIRETDYAVRYGGDEFLIILPAVSEDGTHQIITRIGASLRNTRGMKCPITLSAGCARRSECVDQKALIALADARMYANKLKRSNMPDTLSCDSVKPGNCSLESANKQ